MLRVKRQRLFMVEEEWLEEVAKQEGRLKVSPMLEHFVRGLLLKAAL